MMYAAPNRRTTHRLAKLDLPTQSIFRAPGECPGMFALESAMDELAVACGIDPVEFRVRNEPAIDPDTEHPFSSRGLIACLREGARRFGWDAADRTPRPRRQGRWYVGTGVAARPIHAAQAAQALARVDRDRNYTVLIDASDIGTGTWTALTQIAADALDVPVERVHLEIGDSALPRAPGAGGSMGIASWGTAICDAAQKLRARLHDDYGGVVPADGLEAHGDAGEPRGAEFSMHAFGAQFAEVRVDADTGEVRVPRLVGVFAVGRMINAKTGRSQLLGGMTMGLSMALHEERSSTRASATTRTTTSRSTTSPPTPTSGASTCLDRRGRSARQPDGCEGHRRDGITGTAAAIANAVHHATGIRVRDLPIRLDKLLR